MKKIVFVCTGNTCRSPMAEGYLKSKALYVREIISRGLMADGSPVSKNSVSVMKEIGIDISSYISARLTYDEAEKADKIVCMSTSHADILEGLGVDKLKIHILGVPDPFGQDIEAYRNCRDQIISAVDELLEDGIL